MKNIIDIFNESKDQLGIFPSMQEKKELKNKPENLLKKKPSVLLEKKNSEKRTRIEHAYQRYLKRPNQSWYVFLRNIMLANPERIVIKYRGTNITNEEATLKIDKVATKLYRMGVRKGDVIPVCMANTPEFFYVQCALNLLGAKCNSFSSSSSLAQIEEILKNSSDKVLIATDHDYEGLEDYAEHFKKILLSSRGDSIKQDAQPPKYYSEKLREELTKYYHYENTIPNYKRYDRRIGVLFDSLLKTTPDKKLIERSLKRPTSAEEICSISYSNANSELNVQEEHSNAEIVRGAIRQLIINQAELPLDGLISLVNLPNDSYLGNTTQMLNVIFQKGIIALEPQTEQYLFLESLYINQPNIVYAPKNMFINALNKVRNYIDAGIEDKLSWLLMPTALGTPLNAKEEKILNSFLKYENAGIGIDFGHKKANTSTIMSVVSGDNHNGNLFYSNYKYYKNILSLNKNNCDYGLEVQPDVEVAVLDPRTYEELDFKETGLIVARRNKSDRLNPNNSKANIITDAYGRKWENLDLEGSLNKNGTLNILGKMPPKIKNERGKNISLNAISELALEIDRVFQACTYYSKEEGCIVVNYRPCKNKSDKEHGVERFTKEMAEDIKSQLRYKIALEYGAYINCYIKVRRVASFPVDEYGNDSIDELKKLGLKNTEDLIDIPETKTTTEIPEEIPKLSKEEELAKYREDFKKNLESYEVLDLGDCLENPEITKKTMSELKDEMRKNLVTYKTTESLDNLFDSNSSKSRDSEAERLRATGTDGINHTLIMPEEPKNETTYKESTTNKKETLRSIRNSLAVYQAAEALKRQLDKESSMAPSSSIETSELDQVDMKNHPFINHNDFSFGNGFTKEYSLKKQSA